MSHTTTTLPLPLYGMVAEFDTEEGLIAAARNAKAAGYQKVEAYTPYPVHGLNEPDVLNLQDWIIPLITFMAGVGGAITGLALQYYTSVIDYRWNVGGKPAFSWPQFIPVTFECTILAAALTGVVAMFALNGLPRPHHPIFNAPRFELASQSSFFLCIEAADGKFDIEDTEAFLLAQHPLAVSEVEN